MLQLLVGMAYESSINNMWEPKLDGVLVELSKDSRWQPPPSVLTSQLDICVLCEPLCYTCRGYYVFHMSTLIADQGVYVFHMSMSI